MQSIFDTVIDGIITINEDAIVESLNPAAARIFGYQPDEVIGKNINMLMPEPFRTHHDQYLQNYLKTGVKKIIGIGREVPGLRKDGSTFPFLLSISEVVMPNRRFFTGIVHDISEIKKAENALRESENKFNSIINNAVDGIIAISEQGIIEMFNPAASRLFGYAPEEVIGRNVKMLMPEHDSSRHDSYLYNYKTTHIGKIIGIGREVIAKRKNGSTFPFLLSISEVNLPDRRFFTGIIHDISEIKKAENALRESENKFNSIISNAVDGIVTISDRGIIETFNPAASELFGYAPEEVIGKNVNVLMPEPESSLHDSYIMNYLRTGTGKIIGIGREVTAKKKDGTLFPITLSVSEVKLNDRIIFTGIVHDITEQKIIEEKLRRHAAALERSNSDLQDFAYVSSHDLQEPLRKIQSFGDRLQTREAENLTETGKDYLERMLNAASRMQRLISDLLSFSRVTSQAKAFAEVNLNEILKEVLSDLEVSLEKTKTHIDAEKLPTIQGEPTHMRQLFQNLISNAIKFRKDGVDPLIKIYSKNIQKKDHLTSTPGDQMVELYFEDNGIGFNEKYLDKIFNIFQRLEGQKYEGSGVGLAICRKIAMHHGGDITAKSIPGQGATFIVTLAKKQTKTNDRQI